MQAARRQLSNKSSRSSLAQGSGEQQQSLPQQQQASGSGVMEVQVSATSLTLTVSDVDEDDGMIPDDISLPLDVSTVQGTAGLARMPCWPSGAGV